MLAVYGDYRQGAVLIRWNPARVSTTDQDLNLQIDALLAHGVTKKHVYCDKLSGAREDRPGLAACNAELRNGDTLVVWRLDQLGGLMRHLVNMIEDLKARVIVAES